MASRAVHSCAQRVATEALAHEELSDAERDQAEQHVAQCASCRALYRQLTVNRLPRIRNYTILTELGRGGFGIVYKAVHHGKGRCEALKLLFGRTAQRTAYFENEVRLVAQLRHPNIATLYDASLHTTPLYYTMEFVQGEHLDDYFRSHEVSLEERIELVKTVAMAVGYAHRQGVIHRDLKPQNILVDPQGQPRIVDFGIAKRLGLDASHPPAGDDPQLREGALGTFGYIAPEQLAGQEVDARADIYGLGALLFHVITGQPARFATEVERLTEILHERQVSRADDLAAIIACCVRPAPEERYANCDALVADLNNYLAGRVIMAHANSTPGYRIARVAALVLRNYPRTVQVAALLFVAVVLVALCRIQGAGGFVPAGAAATPTVLVGFTTETQDALQGGALGAELPALDPANPKSYRVLYGRVLEKLAEAHPTVVVWDYFFPMCQPEFDPAFTRGLRAVQAPVIVGAKTMDANAEPALCPDIRAAVHGWGLLASTPPKPGESNVYPVLAVQRGRNPLIPSLAIAGFAAARHPDCSPDVRVAGSQLEVRYRRRQVPPEGLRFPYRSDFIPFIQRQEVLPGSTELEPGDGCYFGGFGARRLPEWARNAIRMEDVLTGDASWLREKFAGRAVLIGQLIPGIDQHETASGEAAFGCQIQAMVLADLLAGALSYRFAHEELVLLILCACVGGALLAGLVPVQPGPSLRLWIGLAAALVMGAAATAMFLTQSPGTPGMNRIGLGICAALAGAGTTLIVKLLHQRQLRLTPGIVWVADNTGASTTVLASSAASLPNA